MGYAGREFDFTSRRRSHARSCRGVARGRRSPVDAHQHQLPGRRAEGIEVTRLGKRLYNDELKLVEEDADGRRRYEIYGFEPSHEDEDGHGLTAVAGGRIRSRRSTSTSRTTARCRASRAGTSRRARRVRSRSGAVATRPRDGRPRAAELRRLIAEPDQRYYELDDPTIGDDDYDDLMRRAARRSRRRTLS